MNGNCDGKLTGLMPLYPWQIGERTTSCECNGHGDLLRRDIQVGKSLPSSMACPKRPHGCLCGEWIGRRPANAKSPIRFGRQLSAWTGRRPWNGCTQACPRLLCPCPLGHPMFERAFGCSKTSNSPWRTSSNLEKPCIKSAGCTTFRLVALEN